MRNGRRWKKKVKEDIRKGTERVSLLLLIVAVAMVMKVSGGG